MQFVTHSTPNTHRLAARRVRAAALLVVAGLCAPAAADVWSWNAGSGNWMTAGNWSPNSVPGFDLFEDIEIRIGDLPGVQNSTVLMNNAADGGGLLFDHLSLYNGMTLDMNGRQLGGLAGIVSLTGANSRLIVRSSPGFNFHDFTAEDMTLSTGAHLEMADDGRLRTFSLSSLGLISGSGTIHMQGAGPGGSLHNHGTISGSSNGGLTFIQEGAGRFNLDGNGAEGPEPGQLSLASPFSVLTFEGDQLTDFFSGTVTMGSGSLLNMNMSDGWTADADSAFNVASGIAGAAAQIDGGHFTFAGDLNIGGSHGHLRVLADTTFLNNADVFLGNDDRLEFDGETTVEGGLYNLSQGARIDFDGPATMQGGHFETASNSLVDGGVYFNGETDWRGNVVIDGAARQNGAASVNGSLGAVITAGMFDMDGAAGNTNWDVNANFVVNADNIGTTAANYFGGTFDIAGGFTPRVTINLTDPDASWVMGGALEMTGDALFYHTRLGGSHMIVQGDLELSPGRARITADTTFSGVGGGADVTLAANADLQMQGRTVVENGANFHGTGTLRVGVNGDMTIEDGVSLGAAGLVNDGTLRIDDVAGIVNADRFTNGASGTWVVSLGGYNPGDEHDLLNVLNDATLGGEIAVEHLDLGAGMFRPHVGDEFTVLTAAGGVSGAFLFDPVSQVGTTTYEWTVLYNPSSVVLRLDNVVPAPGAAFAFATFGAMALRRRRA